MNAITKSKTAARSTGGGCGCSSGGCSGGDCGCGGKCQDECAGGPLQRPLFFAGQLLTESDLQLLSDYVATKGRLHNRFLHGAGVVCGLQVGCHPCGGGKVIVHPGAALDCCGNDIYVLCAVELDINKMVNDLRIKLRGGHDCGDPCAADCKDSPDDVKCLDRKGRRYCLYVEYCEELEEPVTPYVSNGDCAVQVCKPTRIHEGYKFELRCETEEPEPDSILNRIRCCIGDLTSADKSASDAVAAEAYSRQYMKVATLAKSGHVAAFTEADRDQLKASFDGMSTLRTAALDNGPKLQRGSPITERLVRRALDLYQSTASTIIRYDLQSGDTKEMLQKTMPGIGDEVERARGMIQFGGAELRTLSASHLGSARDRVVADMWISQGMQWTDPKLASDQKASEAQLLYAYNAPTSLAQSRQFSRDLAQLRDWLVDRLDHKSLFSDCRLRRDVLAIQLPDTGRDDPGAVAPATVKLVEALLRYLIDCICAALNPPCQPCDDDAVKLACLTVEECEVVRICNLERTYVLSGPAMRYWLPFLHSIGELFERACCTFNVKLPERGDVKPPPADVGNEVLFMRSQGYMQKNTPAYAYVGERPQFAALMQIANIDQSQLSAAVNLLGDVGGLAIATRDFQDTGIDLDVFGFGRRAKSNLIDTMAREPGMHEALIKPVETELAAMRMKVDKVDADSGRLATEIERKVAGHVDDTRMALERRLADTESTSETVARELRAALQDQGKQVATSVRDINKSLEKRVAREEAAVQTMKELQVALRDQKKLNETLERRLARLEAGGR